MQTMSNTGKFGGKRTFNGLFPTDLPKVFPIIIDMTATASFPWNIDLGQEQDIGQIGFVQGVYIDNRTGIHPLILTTDLGQVIECPSLSQGFFTVFSDQPRFTLTTSDGTSSTMAQTNLFFTNFPVSNATWKVA